VNDADRFWKKVDKSGDCWLWISGRDRPGGYGQFSCAGKQIRAHRYSWELHNGSIPEGLWVLHRCDNPPCVNPAHLFIGDRKANMDDAAAKGRICTVGKSRLTHCKRGHPFDKENTHRRPNGQRRCRICQRNTELRWREDNREYTRQYARDRRAAIRAEE